MSDRDTAILSTTLEIPWELDPIVFERTYQIEGEPEIHLEIVVPWFTRDAVKSEGIRVNLTSNGLQRLADRENASALTSLIADAIWLRSQRLSPCIMPADAMMGSLARMADHSKCIDDQIRRQRLDPNKIMADVGKDWILHTKGRAYPDRDVNYGWHGHGTDTADDGKTRIIQSVGTAHKRGHVDYSQTARFWRGPVAVLQVYRSGATRLVASLDTKAAVGTGLVSHAHDPSPTVSLSDPHARSTTTLRDILDMCEREAVNRTAATPPPSPKPNPIPLVASTLGLIASTVALARATK